MQMQMLKTSLEWLTEQQIRFDLYNWIFARKASVSFLSSQHGWLNSNLQSFSITEVKQLNCIIWRKFESETS